MKVIKTNIRDAAELRQRFLKGMNHGGLFVPGLLSLSVGEDVCLWCAIKSHVAELHLWGTVYWIRHRPGPKAYQMKTGSGIGFKSGHEQQLTFLEHVIDGSAEPFPRRRSPRTPLLSPWRCELDGPNDTAARNAMLVDISKGGAQVVVGNWAVRQGLPLRLALPWRSGIAHEMSIAWNRQEKSRQWLGLTRKRSGSEADREWAELVADARQTFTTNVVRRSAQL